MDELKQAEIFVEKLLAHAKRKADTKMYDAANRVISIDKASRYVAEEHGEVASAVTRERWLLAEYECFDLAHTVFLLWLAIRREHREDV